MARDIRRDLRERRDYIKKQREDYKLKLAELDQAEASVNALLEYEDQQWGGKPIRALVLTSPSDDHTESNAFGRTPLSHLILETLKDSSRALGLDDFKKHAETTGFDFGEKSPGRTLHWALVGLAENGHLVVTGRKKERRYRLKEEVPQITTRAEAVQ
jgi:hypothetical protein